MDNIKQQQHRMLIYSSSNIHIYFCSLTCKSGVYSKCTDGTSQVIYSEGLSEGVTDWSWASTRKFDCDKPVHSGKKALTFVAKNNEGLYLNLKHHIDPSKDCQVSFWIHGGTTGNQKLYIRFTSNKVAVSKDFVLWGSAAVIANGTSLMPNKWVNAVINTNYMDPGLYDGIQILTQGTEDQGRIFIDDIQVMKRCASDSYRNYNIPVNCGGKDCVFISVKEDKNVTWVQNGNSLQQYTVSLKNMNKKPITAIEFTGAWFYPRDKKDIWGIEFTEAGNYAVPSYIHSLAPGEEFKFGCVSKVGAVSFKITYVAFEIAK